MAHVPFVTIAVPCFNEERYIETFLADVFEQDYPDRWRSSSATA
jgi:glycosyltransferase involved in cell wall biosynthesis